MNLYDHLKSYIDYLRIERQVAKNTIESYQRDIERYLKFLQSGEKLSSVQITQFDIEAFLETLHQLHLSNILNRCFSGIQPDRDHKQNKLNKQFSFDTPHFH